MAQALKPGLPCASVMKHRPARQGAAAETLLAPLSRRRRQRSALSSMSLATSHSGDHSPTSRKDYL